MKTTSEKIEVMTHFMNGGKVGCKVLADGHWKRIYQPEWNWSFCDYRKMKELSREEITENWIKENDPKKGDYFLVGEVDKKWEHYDRVLDNYVGKKLAFSSFDSDSITLIAEDGIEPWFFPVESLTKVEPPTKKEPITESGQELAHFTLEDAGDLLGMVVRSKVDGALSIIVSCHPDSVIYGQGWYWDWEDSIDHLEFWDFETKTAKPFGKLINNR